MNKQSNTYTVIYIIAVVLIVGVALALTAMALKPRQQENANIDKMKQILSAVHINASDKDAPEIFAATVSSMLLVDTEGKIVKKSSEFDAEIFDTDIAKESKKADAKERLLPVYVCGNDSLPTKYIIPMSGAGLWGPIWGYVAVDDNGSTIYGAFFSHEGETPGLGAEIANPEAFGDKFRGLNLIKGDEFMPVTVIKAGSTPPADGRDYIDGISGGTITSKGVGAMLDNCLLPYKAFLESLGAAREADTQTADAVTADSEAADTQTADESTQSQPSNNN